MTIDVIFAEEQEKRDTMPPFRLAIIDTNILTCLGLQQILKNLLPMAEIVVCNSITELESQENQNFIHYFVSSRLYFEQSQFFRNHPHKSIVLVNGDMMVNGVYTLNVCQNEASLVRDILALQSKGHGSKMGIMGHPHSEPLLSAREVEVAVLLCKGYINKEIASQLDISITTVITHRKNIMEKLHARSLADIIIYSVMNGLVNVEDL